MGFYEIKENMVLNIRDLGLKVGDNLVVYCVGGGGGGGASIGDGDGYNAGSDNYQNIVIGFGASGGGTKGYTSPVISLKTAGAGAIGNMASAVITLEEEEIPVTIGERGLGGDRTNTAVGNGKNGGSTSFGSYVTATGGNGGRYGANAKYPTLQYGYWGQQRGRFGYISPGVLAKPGDVFKKEYSGRGVVWLYW